MLVKSQNIRTINEDYNCLVTTLDIEPKRELKAIDFSVITTDGYSGLVGVVSIGMNGQNDWILRDYPVYANQLKGFRKWLRINRRFNGNEFLKIVWKDQGYHDWMSDRALADSSFLEKDYDLKIKTLYK